MSAVVVGFISEKGGVGKTTCCYHFAIGLQRFYKKRVLVLDTDYQRGGITIRLNPSMLEHFKKGKVPNNTLYSVFQAIYMENETIPKLDVIEGKYGISLVPSDPRLARVTLEKFPGAKGFVERNEQLYNHLSAVLKAIEPFRSDFDYILIDTHPEISDLLNSVIFACDYCVSPVKLDLQSSVGVPSAIEAINHVNEDAKKLSMALEMDSYQQTKFAGAIGMMAREYGDELIYTMKKQYIRLKNTDSIFTNYITEGDGIRIAAERYVAVFDVDGSISQKQSHQFQQVIAEFLRRCK